jgi:hypothetical protein
MTLRPCHAGKAAPFIKPSSILAPGAPPQVKQQWQYRRTQAGEHFINI